MLEFCQPKTLSIEMSGKLRLDTVQTLQFEYSATLSKSSYWALIQNALVWYLQF